MTGWPLNKEMSARSEAALDVLVELYGRRLFMGDHLVVIGSEGGFGNDKKFVEAFLGASPDHNEIGWAARLNTLVWAARNALRVEGDFVECGVFRGFMSHVVCRMLDFAALPRIFRLYDTFEGLVEGRSAAFERDSLNPYYKEAQSAGYTVDAVRARFAPYPNVRVIPGIVPDIFEKDGPDRIAFLHIDMNAASAEVAALDALFDRVSDGGVIVLDDYGRSSFVAMHVEERRWFAHRGHPVLELPTGQGLVVKRG